MAGSFAPGHDRVTLCMDVDLLVAKLLERNARPYGVDGAKREPPTSGERNQEGGSCVRFGA